MEHRKRRRTSPRRIRRSLAIAGCCVWVTLFIVSGGLLLLQHLSGRSPSHAGERVALWMVGFILAAVFLLWVFPRADESYYVHPDPEEHVKSEGEEPSDE